jgi:hypothetical protein
MKKDVVADVATPEHIQDAQEYLMDNHKNSEGGSQFPPRFFLGADEKKRR